MMLKTRLNFSVIRSIRRDELPPRMLNLVEHHVDEGHKVVHCERCLSDGEGDETFQVFIEDKSSGTQTILRYKDGDPVVSITKFTRREASFFSSVSADEMRASYAMIKRASSYYCSCCGEDFENGQLVHYVPIDNNSVCLDCSGTFRAEKELRVYQPD